MGDDESDDDGDEPSNPILNDEDEDEYDFDSEEEDEGLSLIHI